MHHFGQIVGADNQRRIDRIKVCFLRHVRKALQPDLQLLQTTQVDRRSRNAAFRRYVGAYFRFGVAC